MAMSGNAGQSDAVYGHMHRICVYMASQQPNLRGWGGVAAKNE